MKKSTALVLCLVLLLLLSCGGKSISADSAIKSFMNHAKSGNIKTALKLIKNRFDKNINTKISRYFLNKVIVSYSILPDNDPKAKIARQMGSSVVTLEIKFTTGTKKAKFILRKTSNGSWVISNIMM